MPVSDPVYLSDSGQDGLTKKAGCRYVTADERTACRVRMQLLAELRVIMSPCGHRNPIRNGSFHAMIAASA